ncbi:MAG: (d)CMP kinase [Proteobacteria bacterium]|nr:(d)CMP kinase [Pseudomonadota bacterium]
MIIAIDGPAAAGKGTLARRLADHLGYVYLDTGKIYRAVGLKLLRGGSDPNDGKAALAAARAVIPADLHDPGLLSDQVAEAASIVAAQPAVRAVLLEFQRNVARTPPGAVLDGRDIGTVVCPDADVKFYVFATVERRAERRLKELQARGEAAIYDRVLRDMKERDARDAGRGIAALPLKAAPDACAIDTSGIDAERAFQQALDFIARRNRAAG